MKISLTTTVEELPRVGPALSKKLHQLGLHTVWDLLHHYPFRYDDFSHITTVSRIHAGEPATLRGRINLIANRRSYRRRLYITECLFSDDTGSIKAVWFNQPFITKLLGPGDTVYLSGTAENSSFGLQLQNPSYEKAQREQTHTARIVPIYSLTGSLTEKQVRYLIKLVLPLAAQLPDWLPDDIRQQHQLAPYGTAIREVHFPTSDQTLEQARRRLKFNELFLIQLRTQAVRQALQVQTAPAIPFDENQTKQFVASLPFQLTAGQKKTAWQIIGDLAKATPMNRLLEGDVGSGKTVVAALAVLNVVRAGYQAALMAPTEILAQQHYTTIRTLFRDQKIPITLLTRTDRRLAGQPTTTRKVSEHLAAGQPGIVIGTHALIQSSVVLPKLGLVIVDEQHRFGVDQRRLLKLRTQNNEQRTRNITVQRSKSEVQSFTPHLLSMTATPIPRSLALTLYGDLDLSVLTEMPHGRKKIITRVVPPADRDQAYTFVRMEVAAGRQVFVICPLIEESDKLGVRAATAEFKKLSTKIFPDLSVGLLHGKLKPAEKLRTMEQFQRNEINILVATAVVEVGVDIPNASLMLIEGAERFGLAQLHQFRGRVGRAEQQSYCLVFTESDSEKTLERLQAMVTARNGFELAEKDLEFRGPGVLYGSRQSGFPDLKIASLADTALIQETRQAAQSLFQIDPTLSKHPPLAKELRSFSATIHLE
ncbi:MAG: ATP-dependent DNA helicase RecG [Patescibacteria group bacterium]